MNRSLLPDAPPPVPFRRSGSGPRIPGVALIFIAAIFLVAIAPMWVWFFCRIEPGPGEIAVLIHKTGKDLPSGQILAEAGSEGHPAGRSFRGPLLPESVFVGLANPADHGHSGRPARRPDAALRQGLAAGRDHRIRRHTRASWRTSCGRASTASIRTPTT